MSLGETLEGVMLGCFSIGWYWSIFTMVWTRRPYGKSAVFVGFTVLGYSFGLTAHLLCLRSGDPFSYLIILYAWNLAVTLIDLGLVLYPSHNAPATSPPAAEPKTAITAPARFQSDTSRDARWRYVWPPHGP